MNPIICPRCGGQMEETPGELTDNVPEGFLCEDCEYFEARN